MRIVAICATIALLANASPSASDAFDFASVIHIEPAVGAEHRGFHFVVTTLAGQKRVAWGAAIRGELVAVDFSTDGEPSVLYNRQDPGPSAQLFQSRTIHWLPGGRVGGSSPGPLAGALATTTSGVFVVSNRGMELINATIPSNPATLAVVNFSQPTSAHLDSGDDGLALNGLALLEQSGSQAGTSQLIMVGAAMSGSLCASQIDVNTEASTDSPITMSKFGTWVGPLQSAFDIDIFNSSQFGRLLVVVSPHGGTLLTVVSVTSANDRTRVLPTAQWSVHSTVANPAGWPANTGCNRVRVHPAGYAFVSCFDAALNNVMVIDLTLAQPKVSCNLWFRWLNRLTDTSRFCLPRLDHQDVPIRG